MVRRQRHSGILTIIFSLFLFSRVEVRADLTTDCHVSVDGLQFDLSSLSGEHNATRTRESPPTTIVESLRFNLCAELEQLKDVDEKDQCPTGTRACLTKTSKRSGGDWIVAVIPIAQTSELNPSYSIITSDTTKPLSIQLHGPKYPYPTNKTEVPQSLNMTLFCSKETSDPEIVSYDFSQLELTWSTPAGCPVEGNGGGDDDGGDKDKDKDNDKGKEESVGSGVGWFFLVILLSFAAYFGLGAYYNYSTYGARGADLIPHRDFWQEVPYMLRDVTSHICSTVRPRRTASRGGYISV